MMSQLSTCKVSLFPCQAQSVKFKDVDKLKVKAKRYRPGTVAIRTMIFPQDISRIGPKQRINLKRKRDNQGNDVLLKEFEKPALLPCSIDSKKSSGISIADKQCFSCNKPGRFLKRRIFCIECVDVMSNKKLKMCNTCKNWKKFSEFLVVPDHLFGILGKCRPCQSKDRKARRAGTKTKPCEKCKQNLPSSQYDNATKFCKDCVRVMIIEQKKQCLGPCRNYLDIECFSKVNGTNILMSCQAICQKCTASKTNDRSNTLNGRMNSLWLSARQSASRRGATDEKQTQDQAQPGRKLESPGGEARGHFSVIEDDLHRKWFEQHQRCFYSGVKMCLKGFNDWLVSLERLKQSGGYSDTNSVLCANEFNGKWQWSLKLMDQWADLMNNEQSNCFDEVLNDEMTQTLKNFIKNSKSNTKQKRSDRHLEHDLLIEDVIAQWIIQRGRCAYSNIPLKLVQIQRDEIWAASLERLNTKLGYIKGNIVFIWKYLNTADRTCMRSDPVEGSAGWSREKVQLVLKIYNERHNF